MTSSSAPSTTSSADRTADRTAGSPGGSPGDRARWRRAVSGLLMAASLAVTTACGIAADEGGSAAPGTAGAVGASGSAAGSAGSGATGTSGSTGTRLAPGSSTVTHALSQGS